MNINIKLVDELEHLVNEILADRPTHGLGRSLRALKKELSIYKSHSGKGIHVFTGKVDKLQIGGGKHTLPGFLNIDIFEPADLIFDIREGIPLESTSVNFIFSEHFMEHIDYPKSTKFFISECFRILNTDGQIVIGVPDTQKIIKGYMSKDSALWQTYLNSWYKNRDCLDDFNTYIDLVNYHMRDQDDSEKYNPHFWGYDFEKLESLLVNAGFKSVRHWEFDSTIANPKREFGSVYVVATK